MKHCVLQGYWGGQCKKNTRTRFSHRADTPSSLSRTFPTRYTHRAVYTTLMCDVEDIPCPRSFRPAPCRTWERKQSSPVPAPTTLRRTKPSSARIGVVETIFLVYKSTSQKSALLINTSSKVRFFNTASTPLLSVCLSVCRPV